MKFNFSNFSLSIIICTFTLATPIKIETNSRIVGGNVVDIAKHPYCVSMHRQTTTGYVHICSGAIYSKWTVITAAQCIEELGENQRAIVVAGANAISGFDGYPFLVKEAIAHSDYNSGTVDYDIGLLILVEPFNFDYLPIKAITIREKRPNVNKIGTVSGWGYRDQFASRNSYLLEDVDVPIVSVDDCKRIYGEKVVTDRMICAGYLKTGGKDACQGDGGSPLIVDNQLVGLVSWGVGCARPYYPTVYTFVSSLKKWIDDKIAENGVA